MRTTANLLFENLDDELKMHSAQLDDFCGISDFLNIPDTNFPTFNFDEDFLPKFEEPSPHRINEHSMDDLAMHLKPSEGIFICENTVFDMPRPEGPPRLCSIYIDHSYAKMLPDDPTTQVKKNQNSDFFCNDDEDEQFFNTNGSNAERNVNKDDCPEKNIFQCSTEPIPSTYQNDVPISYTNCDNDDAIENVSTNGSVHSKDSDCMLVGVTYEHSPTLDEVPCYLWHGTSSDNTIQNQLCDINLKRMRRKLAWQQMILDCKKMKENNNEIVIEYISPELHSEMGPDEKHEEHPTKITNEIILSTDNVQSYTSSNVITPKKSTQLKPNSTSVNLSPELFSDNDTCKEPLVVQKTPEIPATMPQQDFIVKNERRLFKKVIQAMKGVPPPPSMTDVQISVNEILEKIHHNDNLFLKNNEQFQNPNDKNNFFVINSEEDIKQKQWPEVAGFQYHGLHFNSTAYSENLDFCCSQYSKRYVANETASSCNIWNSAEPSSATKRRNAKQRWGVKSPGRRLSHLAKRRIMFSSSNLQSGSVRNQPAVGSSSTSRLTVETSKKIRKSPRKSPWKKSPQKPNRTPKSASKYCLNPSDNEPKPGSSRMNSTKRALFQSPEHNRSTISSTDCTIQRNKSKRALFVSPKKNSPLKHDKKRKRADEECHPNKFPRSLSFDTPSSSSLNASSNVEPVIKKHSEATASNTKDSHEEIRKKKLLWAISEALRSQQIQFTHPKFRAFGKILCKVVQHQMPDILNGPRQPGSTSERMLRIARQYVRSVIQGETLESILQQIKETNAKNVSLQPSTSCAVVNNEVISTNKKVLQNKELNTKSGDTKNLSPNFNKRNLDENGKARIRRQIFFDDDTKTINNEKSMPKFINNCNNR